MTTSREEEDDHEEVLELESESRLFQVAHHVGRHSENSSDLIDLEFSCFEELSLLRRDAPLASGPRMCCTSPAWALTGWWATRPSLWRKTPSAWPSPVKSNDLALAIADYLGVGVAPEEQVGHEGFPEHEGTHFRVRLVMEQEVQRVRAGGLLAHRYGEKRHRHGHRL